MLGRVKKRKKIDSHELQSLRNVVKRGGDTIIKDFENTFQEIIIEGKRKKASVVNYTQSSSRSKGELETLYMGTSSKAQKQFQRSRSFSRGQSSYRLRSQSQDFGFPRQSRFDNYKSGGDQQRDQSRSNRTPDTKTPTDFP